MIELQYIRAIEILTNNKEKLTVLAELLLEKEVIFKDDLTKIFGKRPFDDELPEIATEETAETAVQKKETKEEDKKEITEENKN